jgi:hypothetical protein
MRRSELAVGLLAVLVALGAAPPSFAQQAAPAEGEPGEEEAMPAGHPDVGASANPHAHPGKAGSMPGVFEPPEDVEREDPTLPPGTIVVELHDADDKPVPNETLTLGILINSIAKGDTHKHMQATTDAAGRAVFGGLDTASNIAYRLSSGYQGGSFAATPFQLGMAKAMHVVLHVYPVVRDLSGALIVAEAAVAAELRDDRIHVEEAMTIYNLGRTAWQPSDVHLALPEGYTAFNAQASMSDQGVDEVNHAGSLRGTFGPGRHAVQFRWQLPWSGEKDVDFDVGLVPHVAIVRVMMPATASVKLDVAGFPPPEVRHDDQNQTFLVTERRVRPDDPHLTSLSIGIHDLPTQGPGRNIAVLIASVGVGLGLFFTLTSARRRRRPVDQDVSAARDMLLDELAELERARTDGSVGPKTYERARRELMDSLARLILAYP